ncbi:MAG: type IX secretion system membrane protein PorP/SprF [Bacteroidota bacterium]|jgi:type IX secretion system PorP/SprF family membrane protein
MKQKTFVLVLIFGLFSTIQAQQLPQYSQWSNHLMAMNPAHTGIKNCLEFHSLYRMQWVGFEGAPRSGFVTFSTPIESPRKQYLGTRHGLGVRFETDRIGQFNMNRINLAYAAHFNFSKYNRLSLGLYGGVIQLGFNAASTTTIAPDPTVNREGSFIAPDASFGAWWNGENYYFGAMLQQMIPWTWPAPGSASKHRLHPAFHAGYRMKVNDKVTFLPAALVKIPPKGPVAVDIQAIFDFSNKLNGGLGYRNGDALIFFAGFKLNQRFNINYSFDLTLSDIRLGSSNTHELSISFTTCRPESTSTYSCPLF